MAIRVTVNLMKWEESKKIGETPEKFIVRIEGHIESVRRNGLRSNYEQYEKETDASRKEWLADCIKYEERKIKRLEREVKKAGAELIEKFGNGWTAFWNGDEFYFDTKERAERFVDGMIDLVLEDERV